MLYNQTKDIAKHYKCTMLRLRHGNNQIPTWMQQVSMAFFKKHNADLAEVQPLQHAPAPNWIHHISTTVKAQTTVISQQCAVTVSFHSYLCYRSARNLMQNLTKKPEQEARLE